MQLWPPRLQFPCINEKWYNALLFIYRYILEIIYTGIYRYILEIVYTGIYRYILEIIYTGNIIFYPFGSLAGFPARAIVLWQENVRGTRNASIAGDCFNVVFKYLRQLYCMLVREEWKFIHWRVSYFPRATPEGNIILVGE
jgi:hypothetical protein